jgi:hypothetical protein
MLRQGNDLVLPISEECIGGDDQPADFQLVQGRKRRITCSAARARAIASPKPMLLPVINARFPCNPRSTAEISSLSRM